MVRKKGTPIYFAVNQRDPMVVQAVKPFKPFGPFVTEVLQMSGREPMQPATVEVQNWRNHSNPAIAHETVDGKKPVQPKPMCFNPTEYKKQIKLSTRCYIKKALKTLNGLKVPLTADERRWFETHNQFKHFFHMPLEKHHKVMGMWMLLLRAVCTEKKKEAWFVVNGTPIRYLLREHALISGLNCQRYPHNYEQLRGLDFARRQFPKGSRMAYADVEEKLRKMEACKIRTGDKAPSVDPFFVRAVNDLEMCKTFPWGRLSFDQNMRDIIRAMDHFGGVVSKGGFTFPSFCTSLEPLPFEAIPQLKKKFRELHRGRTESSCPRMCKSQYIPTAMTGFPLSEINKALGKTKVIESILLPSVDEESMLERIFEEEEDHDVGDVIVDGWTQRLVTIIKEPARDWVMNKVEEEDYISFRTLIEEGLTNSVEKGIKVVIDKVDEMDKRLREVEDFVKEAKEKVASTRNGEPLLVEQVTLCNTSSFSKYQVALANPKRNYRNQRRGLPPHPLRVVKLLGIEMRRMM
ncbi:hypothetical protein Bca4012_051040 [Brassica carinata]